MKETDIRIPIVAEADTGGFEQAQDAAKKTGEEVAAAAQKTIAPQQAAAEQIAETTRALEAQQTAAGGGDSGDSSGVAEARRVAAEAAQKERDASAELANAMRLESMSKKELIAELQKLAKMRKQAAAAQDGKAFATLEKQTAAVRARLGELNKEGAVNKLVTIGQAQAGMQAAESFKRLAAGVQDGSLSVGDMVTQATALATTMQTALGPIGLVMTAIQGLQMAVTAYSNAQKEAAEAQKKFVEATEARQEKAAKYAERQQQREFDALSDTTQKEIAEIDKRKEAELRAFDAIEARRKADTQKAMTDLQEQIKRETAEKEKAAKDNKISQAELEKFKKEKAEELRIATKAEEDAARESAQKRLAIEERYAAQRGNIIAKEADEIADKFRGLSGYFADQDSKGVAEILRRFDELKDRRETADATIKDINKQMNALKDQGRHWWGNDKKITKQVDDLRKERSLIEGERNAIVKNSKDLEHSAYMQYRPILDLVSQHAETEGMTVEEKLRYAQRVQQQGKAAREAAEAAKKDVEIIRQNSKQLELEGDVRQQRYEAVAQTAQTTGDIAIEEGKKKDSQKSINDELEKIEDSTKLIGSYATKDARSEEEIAEADKRTLEEKLEQLRKLQAQPAPDDKTARKLNKAVEDTVKAQKAIEASLRKSRIDKMNKETERELGKLLDTTKLTGNYDKEDERSRRQIMEDDKKLLQAREQELRAMRERANIDPTLAAKIDKELREVQRQTRGLAKAQERNSKEASAWLRQLKPPQLQARNKHLQKSLDGAARQYAVIARRAEEAAKKGNTRQLETYNKRLQLLATAMDRQSKSGQEGTKLMKKTTDALKAVQEGGSKQAKASKGAAEHAKKAEKNAKEAADKAADTAKAEGDAAKNSRAKAKALKRGADKAAAAADAATDAEQQKEEQIRQLNGELAAMRAAMGRMEAEHGKVASGISQLAGGMQSCAAAAGQTAAAASKAAGAAAGAVSTMRRQISNIQKQIDRLNRKL